MRIPSLLTLMALVAVSLAGCTDDGDPETPMGGFMVLDTPTPGQSGSHASYGFPTNGLLPIATDGVMREVLPDGTIQWYRPEAKPLPETLTSIDIVAPVSGPTTAGGITIFGPLAFVGGRSTGPLFIVDIADPNDPVVLSETAGIPVRDADTIAFPDGRLILISTAGGRNIFATDVTDPTHPVLLSDFETSSGNHNIAVVPGTPIVYNTGTGDHIDIVDYSDPANPVEVGPFVNGDHCHDISFFIDSVNEKFRAYCAGYAETEIWDITDPKAPAMLVEVPYPSIDKGLPLVGEASPLPSDPGVVFPLSFSHLAMVNHDATVLIMGDETGGGGINGCDVYLDAAGNVVSGPIGNLWFYDITDEANPVLRGHVSPELYDDVTDLAGSCTAHFGRVIEDTDYLVMAFYTSGVLLVDFSDLSNPLIVDRMAQDGSDVWDVQYHQGYLFTGDIGRGMDVLTLS